MGVFTQSTQIVQNISMVWRYFGPGDIVGGATGWWGLRAYNYASVGSNAVRLREDGTNTEQDFATIEKGGLPLSAIDAFRTSHGGTHVFITQFYDQVGTNHAVQATASQQAELVLSGLGALPIAVFAQAASTSYTTGNVTQAQPYTISTVARRTGLFTQQSIIWANHDAFGTQLTFSTTPFAYLYANGPGVATAATDNIYHALQAVFNGASSDMNVDGASNTGDSGSASQAGTPTFIGTFNGTLQGMEGNILELGQWPSAFTPTQSSNMSANQHAYWGF